MPLETATKVTELNPLWPLGTDNKSEGDDHLRMLKVVLQNMWPVGSVVINTTGQNPGEYIGGTWVAIAEGKAIVGVGDNGESVWSQGDTRGSETHTLTEDEMPAHTHVMQVAGSHRHSYSYQTVGGTGNSFSGDSKWTRSTVNSNTGTTGNHAHVNEDAGGGSAHNNIQPSEAHYVWERTA